MLVNQTISETLAVKGAILPISASTGSLVSNWAKADHTNRLQAELSVGAIVGTCDIALEQAFPNLNAQGQIITANASIGATTLVVSGGVYALNDWVSADGVNFVRVTAAYAGGPGNLSVTALPAAVVAGADIVALNNASTVAALSTGRTSGGYVFAPVPGGQTPALASAPGVYTLDVRASDVNNNNPSPATDGTGNGYNPVQYIRIKATLAVGSSSALVSALLFDAVKNVAAYNFNAPAVVVNQIQA